MINVIDVDDSLVRLDSPILACAGLGESTGCTALLPRTSPAPINWSHDPLPPVKPRLDEDSVIYESDDLHHLPLSSSRRWQGLVSPVSELQMVGI